MVERGSLARNFDEGLLEVQRTASPSGRVPGACPGDGKGEAAKINTPHEEYKSTPAGQPKRQGGNDAKLAVIERSIDELGDLCLGSSGDRLESRDLAGGSRRPVTPASGQQLLPVSLLRYPGSMGCYS